MDLLHELIERNAYEVAGYQGGPWVVMKHQSAASAAIGGHSDAVTR
jgi:hypothetical protein